MLIEVKVGALIMDPNSNTPIVVLKGVEGETILPIWVGAYEANAIALEIEKVAHPRPMTHDLLRNIIVQLGYTVERIVVSDLLDNTFYAVIEMTGENDQLVSLDARPSDAIALALRVDCPIFVEQKVVDISSASSVQTKLDDEDVEDTGKPIEEWPDVIG